MFRASLQLMAIDYLTITRLFNNRRVIYKFMCTVLYMHNIVSVMHFTSTFIGYKY